MDLLVNSLKGFIETRQFQTTSDNNDSFYKAILSATMKIPKDVHLRINNESTEWLDEIKFIDLIFTEILENNHQPVIQNKNVTTKPVGIAIEQPDGSHEVTLLPSSSNSTIKLSQSPTNSDSSFNLTQNVAKQPNESLHPSNVEKFSPARTVMQKVPDQSKTFLPTSSISTIKLDHSPTSTENSFKLTQNGAQQPNGSLHSSNFKKFLPATTLLHKALDQSKTIQPTPSNSTIKLGQSPANIDNSFKLTQNGAQQPNDYLHSSKFKEFSPARSVMHKVAGPIQTMTPVRTSSPNLENSKTNLTVRELLEKKRASEPKCQKLGEDDDIPKRLPRKRIQKIAMPKIVFLNPVTKHEVLDSNDLEDAEEFDSEKFLDEIGPYSSIYIDHAENEMPLEETTEKFSTFVSDNSETKHATHVTDLISEVDGRQHSELDSEKPKIPDSQPKQKTLRLMPRKIVKRTKPKKSKATSEMVISDTILPHQKSTKRGRRKRKFLQKDADVVNEEERTVKRIVKRTKAKGSRASSEMVISDTIPPQQNSTKRERRKRKVLQTDADVVNEVESVQNQTTKEDIHENKSSGKRSSKRIASRSIQKVAADQETPQKGKTLSKTKSSFKSVKRRKRQKAEVENNVRDVDLGDEDDNDDHFENSSEDSWHPNDEEVDNGMETSRARRISFLTCKFCGIKFYKIRPYNIHMEGHLSTEKGESEKGEGQSVPAIEVEERIRPQDVLNASEDSINDCLMEEMKNRKQDDQLEEIETRKEDDWKSLDSSGVGRSVDLQEVDGKDLQQVDGKDLQQVDGKDLQQVDGKDLQQVDGKDIQHVDGKDIQQVDGKDIQQLDGKNHQQVDGKDLQQVESTSVEHRLDGHIIDKSSVCEIGSESTSTESVKIHDTSDNGLTGLMESTQLHVVSNSKSDTNEEDAPSAEGEGTTNPTETKMVTEKSLVKKDSDYDILSCDQCGKKFRFITRYNEHILTHGNVREFKCLICPNYFKSHSAMKSHYYNVHRTERYQCKSCEKSFKYKNLLEIHENRYHKNVFSHVCHVCGQGFYRKLALNDHFLTHTGVKTFECDKCGKKFFTKGKLRSHKRNEDMASSFECEQCGRSFKYKAQLTLHMDRHSGVRKYKCEKCDMAFVGLKTLKKHERTHDPHRKLYKCELCPDKFFRIPDSLKRHNKTFHCDEKPFKCEFCDKTFKLKYLLVQHVRVHADEKEFACEFCGKRFSFNSSLHSHLKVHHPDKKQDVVKPMFSCDICGQAFYHKSGLGSHMLLHKGAQ